MKTCLNCIGAGFAHTGSKQCRCQMPHFIAGDSPANRARIASPVTWIAIIAILALLLKGCL